MVAGILRKIGRRDCRRIWLRQTGWWKFCKLPHVAFGVESLVQLSEANGGDLTLKIWFDFDSSDPIGTDNGQSRW